MKPNTGAPEPQKANRLAREKSPYLQQHAHNPVDWYPWSEEAFARARHENKPIFLSIGYSTCHWCHVMERESFENQQVAALLNRHFVSIKVDREERPDVDRIYMTFVQAMTGHGGWPLNVFVTPELRPFYGGTYWPLEGNHGQPAFGQVLQQVHKAWDQRHEQLAASSAELHRRLEELTTTQAGSGQLDEGTVRAAGEALKSGYDTVHGGWGSAPKFPSPSHASFLLRYGTRCGDQNAIEMVLHTCQRMAAGGIYDQIGGGFHRYSVDERWLVPHFEKMLYDNAQLASLYLDCYLVSGERGFADTAAEVLGYLAGDMASPEGGFFSAEDADSEGKEGKFYCWTSAELQQLLSPDEWLVARKIYGITDQGNFLDHSDPEPLPGQNVVSLCRSPEMSREEALLRSAKAKMRLARARRVRPLRDEKVLASWNGLTLSALAQAWAVLADSRWLTAATNCLRFIQSRLGEASDAKLYHRWCDGERAHAQLLEDYACVLLGVIELYESTLDPAQLDFAVALADSLINRFYDQQAGGFWQAPPEASDLILHVKEDYDGAIPSGNSVAILALLKLGAITGRATYRSVADKSLRLFSDRLREFPQAMPFMLRAVEFSIAEPRRVVISGNRATPLVGKLVHAVHTVFQPAKVVMGTEGKVNDFVQNLGSGDATPKVFLCTGDSCQSPTADEGKIRQLLRQPR